MAIKYLKDSIIFSEKSFTKRVIYSTEDGLCFVLNFKPGQSLPVHKHENSAIVVTVLAGEGKIKINNDESKLTEGAIILAKGQDEFSIPSVTKDLSVQVTIIPNPTDEMYSKNFG